MESPQQSRLSARLSKQPAPLTAKDTHLTEHPQTYSTIGKVAVSVIPSQPIYSFGKATRRDFEKVSGTPSLAKAQFMGSSSPGPVYNPTAVLSDAAVPSWSFPKEDRLPPIQPPYDHYEIVDKASDPSLAARATKSRVRVAEMGIAGRVS